MPQEAKAISQVANISKLFTLEGFMMLTVAAIFDFGEFIVELIPVVGQVLSVGIDIFALLFIGSWMYIRKGTVVAPQKTQATLQKATKWAKRAKWLRPVAIVIEFIPIVSSLPMVTGWIAAVALTLLADNE